APGIRRLLSATSIRSLRRANRVGRRPSQRSKREREKANRGGRRRAAADRCAGQPPCPGRVPNSGRGGHFRLSGVWKPAEKAGGYLSPLRRKVFAVSRLCRAAQDIGASCFWGGEFHGEAGPEHPAGGRDWTGVAQIEADG